MRMIAGFCSLALACASMPVSAQDAPRVLQPSSRWLLDYADDYCRIARQFGGAGQETIFYIEQYEPGEELNVLIARVGFDPRKVKKPDIRFGPDGGISTSERLMDISHEKYGKGYLASGMGLLPGKSSDRDTAKPTPKWLRDSKDLTVPIPLDPERAASISWVEIVDSNNTLFRLELGTMREPIKALNGCIDELLTHWGIDLAKHRERTRPVVPRTDPQSWMGADDYPIELLRKGMQGLVVFRLDVDEAGEPTACHVQQTTRPAEFDRLVCRRLMAKARFDPALDGAGQPTKSYWRSTVRFELPG